MGLLLRDFIVAIIINLIVFVFNYRGLIDGPGPSMFNFLLSVVFLVVWFIFGYKRGKEEKTHFLFVVSIFWIIGLTVSLVCMSLTATPLWIVAFIYLAPLNGIKYFGSGLFGPPLAYINNIVPLGVGILGFILGRRKRKNDSHSINT